MNIKLCFIAKDCLLTGQEQACTRITLLVGLLFRCHDVENGQMGVDCSLVITYKVKPFADHTRKEE